MMKYYTAIRMRETTAKPATRINLRKIMWNEISPRTPHAIH